MHELATRHREHYHDKMPGGMHYDVCVVCGRVEWAMNDPEAEKMTHVRPMHESGRDCRDCTEISQRHPELAAWLARVFFIRDRTR